MIPRFIICLWFGTTIGTTIAIQTGLAHIVASFCVTVKLRDLPATPPVKRIQRSASDNLHHAVHAKVPFSPLHQTHLSNLRPKLLYRYCKFYLAILNCELPVLFFALCAIPIPTPLRLFLFMPSNLALSCSWIFLFCAQSSANFCIRSAATTARAADLSVGRRSWMVMSGVIPICEMRFRSCWLLQWH